LAIGVIIEQPQKQIHKEEEKQRKKEIHAFLFSTLRNDV
jgi:hypothetical protein